MASMEKPNEACEADKVPSWEISPLGFYTQNHRGNLFLRKHCVAFIADEPCHVVSTASQNSVRYPALAATTGV
jgi:hypothetical protein